MRILAKLEIKNNYVIKPRQFEGLRRVGNPLELAKSYYEQNIDELIISDPVASLYNRSNLFNIISNCSEEIFVPICVGGGIDSLCDIRKLLHNGADKVFINSASFDNPNLLKDATDCFGSQSIVASIEAKLAKNNEYQVYRGNGKINTKISLQSWLDILSTKNIGEIMITSIDNDGMQKGIDLNLLKFAAQRVSVPLIYSGGYSQSVSAPIHGILGYSDGLAVASALHYRKTSVYQIRNSLEGKR